MVNALRQNQNESPMEYDHVAKVQLFYAIDFYNKEIYIPAVTLAGAAEEYLNKILKQENKAFEIMKVNLLKIYTEENVDRILKEVRSTKNKLKHGYTYEELEKVGDNIEFQIKDVAKGYILSALLNYKGYYEEFNVKQEWPESFFNFLDTHVKGDA